MIYVDASVLVAAFTPEENSDRALSWMEGQPLGSLCVSGWVETEVSSALARKVRMGALTLQERASILAKWHTMKADSVPVVPLPEKSFETASRLIDRPASRLRAGDALHLAIASLGGHSLATLDVRLAEAALRAGVAVEEVA